MPALPPSLVAEQRGDVAILRLNRAQKRNALNDEIVLGLEAFFTGLPETIKAIVLHGDGEHFSAGLDLSELRSHDITEAVHHSSSWHRVFDKIEFGRVPVVAVMHGAVVGGGLELAAATHVRVAEQSTFYALPEGIRGIFVGGGGSVRVPRLIGTMVQAAALALVSEGHPDSRVIFVVRSGRREELLAVLDHIEETGHVRDVILLSAPNAAEVRGFLDFAMNREGLLGAREHVVVESTQRRWLLHNLSESVRSISQLP